MEEGRSALPGTVRKRQRLQAGRGSASAPPVLESAGVLVCNIGAQIAINIMVPYSLYNYSIWYLKWTSK